VSILTSIEIDASAARVWSVLTDFAAYPQWNPTLPKISGDIRVGGRVRFRVRGVHLAIPANAECLVVEPERELRWIGLAPPWSRIPFHGIHYFRIEPLADDRVRFIHGEDFGGRLVFLLRRLLVAELTAPYHTMNRALQQRVCTP
jgi:hypothetical protein